MASVNKVIIVGNMGADPEQRFAPSGDAICNLRIATTESWKDKATGERKENTEWHRVVLFGKVAEIASQYLRKGSQVYIEGKIATRKWQDKDGQDRYTTEIRGNEMKMLGGKSETSDKPQSQPQNRDAQPVARGSGGDDFTDDIPFDRLARGLAGYAL